MGPARTNAPQLRISPDILERRLGDETVLVHLRTDKIYALNRTGTRLWELLRAGQDLAEIRRQLLGEFKVPEAQLDAEIQGLLASLREARLLEAGSGGASG